MIRLFMTLGLLASTAALADNVLAGRAPVQGAAALSDGQALVDGADWQSAGAVMLRPDEAAVWDLGASRTIDGAALQGDNNDDYILELSQDGVTFIPWWRARGMPSPGLQTRAAELTPQATRFIRLRAEGGDQRYSVSELEIFSGGRSGSVLTSPRWLPRHPVDVAWVWLVVGVGAVLFLVSRSSPPRLVALLSAGAALGTAQVLSLTFSSPMDAPRIDFLRGAVALLGAVAVARELVGRQPAPTRLVLGTLAVAGVMGVLCFLNLGRPQFFDAGAGRPTYLHHYDMRTYYPIARYFPELRFDGVYAASTMVVAEDRGGLEAMADQPLRDLRTHQGTTVGQVRAHIEEVRARFSPERWRSFSEDMGYFRRAMGDGGYLGSMNDHGGNATPVWFLAAAALFAGSTASDSTLWLGVIVDMALVALAFVALWRGWGWRTALVGMCVFGAMDFYQFGSNWFGATLRHDWLALWALGLWALRAKRWVLAGVLLAWSALIRAFPALALMTFSIPVLAELVRSRHELTWARIRERHADALKVVLGAAAGGGGLVVLSSLVFGVEAWAEWLRKVSLLDRDGHINNLAVRTWVTSSTELWLVVLAAVVFAVVRLTRRAPPEIAASWAVVLVPVLFNPANYYMHSAFLLVVLAGETKEGVSVRGRLTWLVLLLMCTASYFTSLVPDVGTHFAADTGVMLTAFGLLMVLHLAPEALFVVPTALAPVSGPPVIVAEESEPEDELEGEQPAAGEGAQAPAEVEGQRSADGTAGALDEDAGGRPQHHG